MVDLSILIPSLYARAVDRASLMAQIAAQPQHLLDRCQVLVDIDNRQATVGAKRSRLLGASTGRYVVFVDDDDIISDDYLERIFEGIDKGVDHVGVAMWYSPVSATEKWRVTCSMHNGWTFDGTTYFRPPQHVCAVKRELAVAAGFPNISFGEDRHYAEALKPLVHSEHVIAEPIYTYRYVEDK